MTEVLEQTSGVEIGRTTLHKGAIVEYLVPTKLLKELEINLADGTALPYLHFPVYYKYGKPVNVHVHGGGLGLAGTKIRARVEIIEKVTPGGQKFVYVDLHLVSDPKVAVDSKLLILPDTVAPQDGWQVFTTSDMQGFVALCGIDSLSVEVIDTQLERLISEGWTVAGEEGNYVHLEMVGKDGELKKLTHFRKK